MSFFAENDPRHTFESGPGGTSERSQPEQKTIKASLLAALDEILNGPFGDKIESGLSKLDKMPKAKNDLATQAISNIVLALSVRRSARKALRNLGLSKDEAKAVTKAVDGLVYISAASFFVAKKNSDKLAKLAEAAAKK